MRGPSPDGEEILPQLRHGHPAESNHVRQMWRQPGEKKWEHRRKKQDRRRVSIFGSFIKVGPFIMGIIGLIEGILYLLKSDEEFYATYVQGKKKWF
jgi:hypothetical protein